MSNLVPRIRLVQDLLTGNVATQPDKVALICGDQRFTYAQLDALSDRLANALCKKGVRDGDRVLFQLFNSYELVIGVFGALKANATLVLADYGSNVDSLRYIAADCGATALCTHGTQTGAARQLLQDIPSLQFAVLTGAFGQQAGEPLYGFDALLASHGSERPPQRTIDQDIAYLLYTSGSTGVPKGVITPHRSSLFVVEQGVDYMGLGKYDIMVNPLPLSYSHGLNQLLEAFFVGGTLILEQSFAFPTITLRRMETEGATGFASVPTVLALFLRAQPERYDLRRLRVVNTAGAAMPPSLARQFTQTLPDVELFYSYGMSEASNALGLPPDQISQRPTSVGRPLAGTQAWLIDETGRRLGSGEIGELVIRGGNVRSGYWNNPAATAERFRPGLVPGEQLCYSGDQFRMDEEGFFYFVGRGDEVIKSGGKKVAPKEVEDALYGLPAVLEAAAIGVTDPVLGQAIKACVVLDPQAKKAPSIQDIRRHCQRTLEAFKVPREIEIRETLPKTPSGKIIKTNLA